MNEMQLSQMTTKKGFIAALDQSGGSTPKALKLYGVEEDSYHSEEEMYQTVHNMRTRIIKSPSFSSEYIIGAILFENTMERKIEESFTADYLWKEKGVVPFLKVDKGLEVQADGVQLMKDMPNLDILLSKAVEHNIFGTKMRSVIHEANPEGIHKVVAQQYEIAKKIISYGLVPIIEPEVDINSPEKQKCEVMLKEELLKELKNLKDEDKVIFKLTIPSENGFYSDLMEDAHVVRVVALSGGYTRTVANEKLLQNPGLIASFSRALSEGLNVKQAPDEFDQMLGKSVREIYEASIS